VLWIPVAIAVLTQALLFLSFEPEIAFDSASYMAQAESLASTGAATNARGEPDTVRTPGYPLYLAAWLVAGFGYAGAIVGQRILWLLVVAATTWGSFRLTRSATASVVAGTITALDLPALQATTSILTETLATVLVVAAVFQAYRAARFSSIADAMIAGALAGVAALVRPVAILLGVPMALAIAITGERATWTRIAGVIVAASLVLPAAWTMRNYARTGVVTFSSIASINLLQYRAAGTLAIRDPGGIDANIQRRQSELEEVACRQIEASLGKPCDTVPITIRATYYSGIALPIIAADPLAVAWQAARAFGMIMFGGGANMLSGITGLAESRTRVLALGYTVPLALLATAGLVFWWRVDRQAVWLILLTIAYFVVMSLGVEAYSRFRVPFLPLYAMLAGGGAAMLLERRPPR
jgi:uncharacterized membrane protein YvlD (DUF360 family)